MDISESGQLYLKNYFILEQARRDANQYLEKIAITFANRVEERNEENKHPLFKFRKYVQNGGGYVAFILEYKSGVIVPELKSIGELKFSISYVDAMRYDSLPSPTGYKIFAESPKSSSKLINDFKKAANHLNIPDPYEETYGEHLTDSLDNRVTEISKLVLERQYQAIQVLEFLIKENQ